MKSALAAALALVATPALAADPGPPVSTVRGVAEASMTGQPVVLPQGPVRVTLTETVIPPHGRLPAHKHPYARYALLQAGRLKVTNLDTGTVTEVKPGDFVVDAIAQWHQAENLSDEPARLMVIDQAPPGQSNTIMKAP